MKRLAIKDLNGLMKASGMELAVGETHEVHNGCDVYYQVWSTDNKRLASLVFDLLVERYGDYIGVRFDLNLVGFRADITINVSEQYFAERKAKHTSLRFGA